MRRSMKLSAIAIACGAVFSLSQICSATSHVAGAYSISNTTAPFCGTAEYWNGSTMVTPTAVGAQSCAFASATLSNDIYVAGFDTVSSLTVGKVWKNGSSYLTLGPNTSGYNVRAESIAAASAVITDDNGDDVTHVYTHVAGYQKPSGYNAMYWYDDNGTTTSVLLSSNASTAYAVYASGTTAYVAGYETVSSVALPTVWICTAGSCSTGYHASVTSAFTPTNGIALANGKLYFSGYTTASSSSIVANVIVFDTSAQTFTVVNLTAGSTATKSYALGLALNSAQSTAYVVGYDNGGSSSLARATYWTLPTSTLTSSSVTALTTYYGGYSYAEGIALDSNDNIFIAGYECTTSGADGGKNSSYYYAAEEWTSLSSAPTVLATPTGTSSALAYGVAVN
jgi:hypothetical protein